MSYGFAVSRPIRHIQLMCVQWKIPDAGQRECLKHVEFYSKNKFEKLVRLVGFIIRIRQRSFKHFMEGALYESNINVSQRIMFGQHNPERCTLLADWHGLSKWIFTSYSAGTLSFSLKPNNEGSSQYGSNSNFIHNWIRYWFGKINRHLQISLLNMGVASFVLNLKYVFTL